MKIDLGSIHLEDKLVKRDPIIVVILELVLGLFGFMGIGHIYNGNIVKGISILLGYWVFIIIEIVVLMGIAVVTCGLGGILIFIIAPINLIVVLGSAYLAYKDQLEKKTSKVVSKAKPSDKPKVTKNKTESKPKEKPKGKSKSKPKGKSKSKPKPKK